MKVSLVWFRADADPDYKSYIQSLTEPSEPLKAEIPRESHQSCS